MHHFFGFGKFFGSADGEPAGGGDECNRVGVWRLEQGVGEAVLCFVPYGDAHQGEGKEVRVREIRPAVKEFLRLRGVWDEAVDKAVCVGL